MPIPEEFVKKHNEVTINKASLKDINCKKCGAKVNANNMQNGFIKCEYCGSSYALDVNG